MQTKEHKVNTLTVTTRWVPDDKLFSVTIRTRANKRSTLQVAFGDDGSVRVDYWARTRWNSADLTTTNARVAIACAQAHRVELNPVAEIDRLLRQ